MIAEDIVLRNVNDIAQLYKLTARFDGAVTIYVDNTIINAKSIISLFSTKLNMPARMEISGKSKDQEKIS